MAKKISDKDAQARLKKDERQKVILIGETIAGYRFRIARGAVSTELIVPKTVTDSQWRDIDKKLELYFSLFGEGNSIPYVATGIYAKA